MLALLPGLLAHDVEAEDLVDIYSEISTKAEVFLLDPDIAPMYPVQSAKGIGRRDLSLGQKWESLVDLEGVWDRMRISQNTQLNGFISASMSDHGIGGVGVTGVKRSVPQGEATATYRTSARNTGLTEAPLAINWRIPEIEVAIHAQSGDNDPVTNEYPPYAIAQATLQWEKGSDEEHIVERGVIFDYYAELTKTGYSHGPESVRLETSADLKEIERQTGNVHPIDLVIPTAGSRTYRETGFRWDEFSGSSTMILAPDGLNDANPTFFFFTYVLTATVAGPSPAMDDRVIGLHALVGDPFDLSGGTGAGITFGPVVGTVPEPTMLWMLLTGGVVLLSSAAWRMRPIQRSVPRLD